MTRLRVWLRTRRHRRRFDMGGVLALCDRMVR